MKYKYYDKPGRLLAESDSPIVFNVARFPVWRKIKPVIDEEKEQEATPDIVVEEEEEKKPKRRGYRKREDN